MVRGRVVRQEPGQQLSVPVPGAEVRAGVDANDDGTLTGDEVVSTVTADDGGYQLVMTPMPTRTAVVQFRAPQTVPVIRTLRLARGANVQLNVNLKDLPKLQCTGDRCVGVNDDLSLFGRPATAAASAQVFDPTREADAAPGGSRDRDGKVLRPAVFAVVELTDDATGERITTLPAPAELCLAVPADTRATVTDVTPGTGQIEMSLFSFDEARGVWGAEGQAVLKDGDDVAIPESAIADVRAGVVPVVRACGSVSHFSWWSVGRLSTELACLSLDLHDENGAPAVGATVSLAGVNYSGVSDLLTADATGNVCTTVPRSETAAEDLDGNGITGEAVNTRIRAQYGDKSFDGGEVEDDLQAGTCPCPARTITLDAATHIDSRLCTLSGRVHADGAPAVGAQVVAFDPNVTQETLVALCQEGQCSFTALTGPDGTFSLTAPMIERLDVFAVSTDPLHPASVELSLPTCPNEAIDLVLETAS